MPKNSSNRRPSTTSSQASRGSNETYESVSTAASSIHGGNGCPLPQLAKDPTGSWSRPRPSATQRLYQNSHHRPSSAAAVADDVSPCTSIFTHGSVDTLESRIDSVLGGEGHDDDDEDDEDMHEVHDDDDDEDLVDDDDDDEDNQLPFQGQHAVASSPGWASRDPATPTFLRQLDHDVLPSNPELFAHLFPSMDRLLIRHDDLTTDGSMNLCVDTIIQGDSRNKLTTIVQLFHLRINDIERREFSLRRYWRGSGREVCKSKRKYAGDGQSSTNSNSSSRRRIRGRSSSSSSRSSCCSILQPAPEVPRPSIAHTVSTALKALTPKSAPGTRRPSVVSKIFNGAVIGIGRRNSGSSYEADTESISPSAYLGDHKRVSPLARKGPASPVPTNAIKLEFSNYARVDVSRLGAGDSKRYEFKWWGHKYAWKRVVDRNIEGAVSFHLIRDGQGAPVAHVVPEARTPTQIQKEECAGGWVPPCSLWISDASIIEAVTDVGDVVVATGLMALIDDCIKSRDRDDRKKKQDSGPRRASAFAGLESSSRALMSHLLRGRRHSDQPSSQLVVH